jgi:ABC-type nickel/cobalt efflux system permease component RcnA
MITGTGYRINWSPQIKKFKTMNFVLMILLLGAMLSSCNVSKSRHQNGFKLIEKRKHLKGFNVKVLKKTRPRGKKKFIQNLQSKKTISDSDSTQINTNELNKTSFVVTRLTSLRVTPKKGRACTNCCSKIQVKSRGLKLRNRKNAQNHNDLNEVLRPNDGNDRASKVALLKLIFNGGLVVGSVVFTVVMLVSIANAGWLEGILLILAFYASLPFLLIAFVAGLIGIVLAIKSLKQLKKRDKNV